MKHKYPRYVYVMRNTVTNRMYVGSSNNPEKRLQGHLAYLRTNRHSVEDMQRDYNEYGNCFELNILDTINSVIESHKEYDWMVKLKSYERGRGYNYKDNNLSLNLKHRIEYNGNVFSITELSKVSGVDKRVLYNRIATLKWDVQRAISEPVAEYHHTKWYLHWQQEGAKRRAENDLRMKKQGREQC